MAEKILLLRIEREADILRLRQAVATIADKLGLGEFGKTRVVTALIELARNTLEYAGRGDAHLSLRADGNRLALRAVVIDQGPGIQDLDTIMGEGGIITSGLGLGLRGVQRIADTFNVTSSTEGTKVDAVFRSHLPAADLAEVANRATAALRKMEAADPAAQLAEQNRELLEAVAARDFLMKEVHHRTGNNLALISALIRMSGSTAQSVEAKQLLGELEARVRAVTKAHELMQHSSTTETVPLLPFLRKIAGNAEEAFNGASLNVGIEVSGDCHHVGGQTALDLGLIASELITNAYKHAFSGRGTGRIRIALTCSGQNTCLTFADDGNGLDNNAVRPERSNSLGWRLIRTISQKYGGTIETNGENGLTVTIRFMEPLGSGLR